MGFDKTYHSQNLQQPANDPIVTRLDKEGLREKLNEMNSKINSFLPNDLSFSTFSEGVIAAFERNPDLYLCTNDSIDRAIDWMARDGVIPDDREAYLSLRSVNINSGKKYKEGDIVPKGKKWGDFVEAEFRNAVVYIQMIDGVIKVLLRYTDVKTIMKSCVYKNDEFSFDKGDNPLITHKVAVSNRGEFIGCYAIFTMKDGSKLREYMPKEEIDKIMQHDKPKEPTNPNDQDYEKQLKKFKDWKPKDVWVKWYDRMAQKTIVKFLSKSVDKKKGYVDTEEEQYKEYTPQINIEPPKTLQPPLNTTVYTESASEVVYHESNYMNPPITTNNTPEPKSERLF